MNSNIAGLERVLRSYGQAIIEQYPTVRQPLLDGWEFYQRTYARSVCYRDAVKYAQHTDLSPFEVVSVDPDRIEYLVEENGYPTQTHRSSVFPASKFKYAGTIQGGEWDRCEMRFEETDLFTAFDAHFNRGVPWTETTFYDRVVEHIEDGIELWGCQHEAALVERCADIDSLYESIREDGYRSQAELAETSSDDPLGDPDSTFPRGVFDEVTVCIGRTGDLLFFDGRNRLAIAKLLDLEEIPVWIMVRHPCWQTYRETHAATGSTADALSAVPNDHPDL